MSSSFSKSKLKLAKEAIGKKDFNLVQDLSNQVLEHEADNYNA